MCPLDPNHTPAPHSLRHRVTEIEGKPPAVVNPRVKTEYASRGEAEGNDAYEVFARGLQWRYRGKYFRYWPTTTCINHFITWPAPLPAYTYNIAFSYFS